MKRSIRQLGWQWVLVGAFLLGGAATSAWAQNVFPSSGAVGIGTTAPNCTLDIVSAGSADICLNAATTEFSLGTRNGLPMVLYSNNVPRAIIDTAGDVGIGTMAPATKLHVAGDVQVDGNLAAKYQDLAEWVRALSPLVPGTVVIVDPQERNQVLPASQSYDTRVAGVVSSKPGLLLGEAGQDKVKVAQIGRVKVKADASYGPIAMGDLLVTSPTPGHAMRSIPLNLNGTVIHRPGTLLGKALEPLEEGQGEILVLLTIQ